MIIKTTTNSAAAAVICTVLSGISSLGNANLQEVDVKSVRISHADLNLNGAAGQETLYQRLRGAADQGMRQSAEQDRQRGSATAPMLRDVLNYALHEVGSQGLLSRHQE